MDRVLSVLCLLAIVSPAAGQTLTATTGAMNGSVVDSTKGVLPGVRVTLSGPSLMGTPSTVTDVAGAYRFSAVPPGEYKLVFELAGFGTVTHEGIRVSVGFIATVNVEMNPGALTENVTVSGAAPVVDVSNSSVATQFDAKKLADLPISSRDFFGVISLAPAVSLQKIDVGGATTLNQITYSSYGITGNRHEVEGIHVGTGTNFFYPDYSSFDEVAVQVVGNSAEMPTAGSYSKIVVKSGGNTYRGEVYADYQSDSMQGHNIDEGQLARGVTGGPQLQAEDTNRIALFRDFEANVGGFVRKDRLWWFAAYRYTKNDVRFPFLLNDSQDATAPVYTGKITYRLDEKQNVVGYGTHSTRTERNYFLGPQPTILNSNAVPFSTFPVYVWKVEYNAAISNSLYAEAHVGQYHSRFPQIPKDDSYRYSDTGANTIIGAPIDTELIISRPMGVGSITYFKNFLGAHNLKVGGNLTYDRNYNNFVGQPSPCNCIMTLVNTSPSQVQLIVGGPHSNAAGLRQLGFYGQDSWQISSRLTVMLGLRFDRYQPYLQPQEGPRGEVFAAVDPVLTWNNWGPRLGISFDVTGDGRTVLKANYGEFDRYPGGGFASSINPNTTTWSETYRWTDPNSNGIFDPGEQGQLVSVSGGTASTKLDPNIKNEYVRETSVYLEREVAPNFGVRTGFVWNATRQSFGSVNINRPLTAYSVPIPIVDPGPDGQVNTADDGSPLTAFNLAPEYLTLPVVNTTMNLPIDADAYTWEVAATRRQTSWWSLSASFANIWSNSAALGTGTSFTPNAAINSDDGVNKSIRWQGRIAGTLNMPWGLRVSPVLRHQAGEPFGRTFVRALNFGNATILAQKVNAGREPNVSVLDIRGEKVFKVRASRIAGFLDVYNIFNTNAEQDITTSSGSSWLRPLLITPPRVARIGVKFNW